jgi:hypothetical protein
MDSFLSQRTTSGKVFTRKQSANEQFHSMDICSVYNTVLFVGASEASMKVALT